MLSRSGLFALVSSIAMLHPAGCDPGEAILRKMNTANSAINADQSGEVTITCRLLPNQRSRKLRDQIIEVSFVNKSSKEITLDRRLLNPVLLLKLQTTSGARVPNLPPSIPRPLTRAEFLNIAPDSSHRIDVSLDHLTDHNLDGAEYRITCCYDTTKGYENEQAIWIGKVNSGLYQLISR